MTLSMKLWELGVFGLLVVAVVGLGEMDAKRARPAERLVAKPGVVKLIPGTNRAANALDVDAAVGSDFDLSRRAPQTGSEIRRHRRLTAQQLARGFRFAPTLTKKERRRLDRIVSFAGPGAKRLISAVDGLTILTVESLHPSILGAARRLEHGRYRIQITPRELRPPRGSTAFTLLHELGHVVDYAVVPNHVRDRLARQYPCIRYRPNPCGLAERFADGFAVWAITTGNFSPREAPKPRLRLDGWSNVLGRLVNPNARLRAER